MSERFFVSPPIAGNQAIISGDEARHLATVMRVQIGADVILFDGSGAEFTGRVLAIRKQAVELTIVERREISRELPFSLTLAVALPKGERQKWLVEKATELGVTRMVPLITERGVAQPVESALERLRAVIEASKQCGRNRLLEITPPAIAAEYFAAASQSGRRLVADPTGQSLAAAEIQKNEAICAAIGPEGGFTPTELSAASNCRWQCVSLGSRILRVETAAVAIAAWASLNGQ